MINFICNALIAVALVNIAFLLWRCAKALMADRAGNSGRSARHWSEEL
jgi:hypothetical protein